MVDRRPWVGKSVPCGCHGRSRRGVGKRRSWRLSHRPTASVAERIPSSDPPSDTVGCCPLTGAITPFLKEGLPQARYVVPTGYSPRLSRLQGTLLAVLATRVTDSRCDGRRVHSTLFLSPRSTGTARSDGHYCRRSLARACHEGTAGRSRAGPRRTVTGSALCVAASVLSADGTAA